MGSLGRLAMYAGREMHTQELLSDPCERRDNGIAQW